MIFHCFSSPVALSRLPNFLADPSCPSAPHMPHHRATIHLNCEDTGLLEEAYLQAKQGHVPDK